MQEAARKEFTIEDIDRSVPYMEAPEDDPSLRPEVRRRPSAAEYMAHWTVQIATNMEFGAEASEGRRVGQRPEGVPYLVEEHGVH